MKSINLNGKPVGDGYPCYMVAEIGGAFTTFEEAKRLIDSSMKMKVDAVKFQTLEAETVTTKNNFFDLETTGHISQYELLKHFELSKDLQKQIVNYANERNMTIFSAPSHIKDLEIMEIMELPIYKIGSDLACHIPLLKKVANFGKPIILSTGMCTLDEIRKSIDAIKNEGNDQIILMHCVANYPSKIEEANLNAIVTMKSEFNLPTGYSDHTVGTLTTLSAVALGSNIIERHFRDETNAPGPDDAHSLIQKEFNELVNSIRLIEMAKGSGIKEPSKFEKINLLTNRVSIIALQDIPEGVRITNDMIDIRRPGTGIQPIYYNEIIGKISKKIILKEEPLKWEMLS